VPSWMRQGSKGGVRKRCSMGHGEGASTSMGESLCPVQHRVPLCLACWSCACSLRRRSLYLLRRIWLQVHGGGLSSNESMLMGKSAPPSRSQSRFGLVVVQSSRIAPVHSCSGDIMGGAGPSIVFCLACLAASCTSLARKWRGSLWLAAISARMQAVSRCSMAVRSANCWTLSVGMTTVGMESSMGESERGRGRSCGCRSECFVDYNAFARSASLYSCRLHLATSWAHVRSSGME